jgi:hypothetical protein
MTGFLRSLALALVALAAPIHAAQAQSIAETLSRWGLLGTWALDCSKPASSSNGYLSYAIRRAGQVSHERDFGDRQDVNEVQQARMGLGGALELVVHFPGLSQTRQFTLVMGVDGRIRTIANSKVDGTQPTIKDGKFTANDADSPWQVRCR